MNTLIGKSISISLVSVLAAGAFFISAEPLVINAATDITTSVITLNVTSGISVTGGANTTMSQSVGAAANTAVATSSIVVTTNNSLGYTLALKATSTPALQSGANSVADYQTSSPNTWSVSSGNANFGYSAFGTDVSTGTWGTDTDCSGANGNAVSTGLKYKGFTTSDVTVATRAATTTTSGVTTTVCYAVEQNGTYIPSGTYQATIIATGTTL